MFTPDFVIAIGSWSLLPQILFSVALVLGVLALLFLFFVGVQPMLRGLSYGLLLTVAGLKGGAPWLLVFRNLIISFLVFPFTWYWECIKGQEVSGTSGWFGSWDGIFRWSINPDLHKGSWAESIEEERREEQRRLHGKDWDV